MYFHHSYRIHPRDKADVAHRLALAGLAVAYGNKSITYQGPFPVKVSAIEFNGTTSGVNIDYGNTTIHIKDNEFDSGFDVSFLKDIDPVCRIVLLVTII